MLKMLCAVLALVLLTSCTSTGPATVDAACVAFRPVYVSRADLLTEETAAQVLAHNRTGQKLCGWKGRGAK